MAAPTPASFVMQGSFAPSSFAPSSFALPLDQASFATTDFSVDGFFKGRDRGLSLNSAVRAASPSRHRGGSLASNVSESETAFSKFKEQSRSNFTFDDPTPVPLVKPVNTAPLEGMLDKQSGNSLSELDPEHTPSPNGHSVSSPTTTHGPSYATATSVLVVDPLSRKLCIPRASIRDTLATSRPGIPSLCLLYTSNKCRQGNQCHQIHADPQVVLRLRAEAKSMSTCCAEHGDVHNHLCRPEWSSRSVEVNGIVIPHAQLAYTGALAKLYNDNPTIERLAVPLQLICRLHGAERCRYSDDCRFIHICRRVLRQHFSGAVEDLVPQLELRHQQTAGSSRHGKTTQSPNTTGVERTPPATTPMSPSTSPHSFVGPITIPSPTSATVMVGSQQFQQQQQRMRPASANTTPIMAFPAPNSRPTSTTPTWMQIGNPTQPIFIAHPGAQGPLPGTPTVLNPSLPLSAGPSYVLVPIQQYNAILASTTPPPTQSSPSPMVMLAATSHDNNSPFQLQSAVRGPQ